jgi:protocatechuate 3,4-dioxygenase beta subunit
VIIHLLYAQGQTIDTTTTDASGQYAFTGLAPGVYGVTEVQPQGYFDGDDHVGSVGGVCRA